MPPPLSGQPPNRFELLHLFAITVLAICTIVFSRRPGRMDDVDDGSPPPCLVTSPLTRQRVVPLSVARHLIIRSARKLVQ